jgi:hypothetical protein
MPNLFAFARGKTWCVGRRTLVQEMFCFEAIMMQQSLCFVVTTPSDIDSYNVYVVHLIKHKQSSYAILFFLNPLASTACKKGDLTDTLHIIHYST